MKHFHRPIAIYVVQIIDTMLGRMCLLRDLRQDRKTQILAAIAMATTIIID